MKDRLPLIVRLAFISCIILCFASSAYSQLPSGWSNKDIGNVKLAGNTTWALDTFRMSGAGADMAGSVDAFQIANTTQAGNGEIVARVMTLKNTNGWAKCGVIIRENLTPNSKYVAAMVTPSNGVISQTRTSDGGGTTVRQSTGKVAPYWVKVTRVTNSFKMYYSANGTTWTEFGSSAVNVSMTDSLKWGLCITSHDTTKLDTAKVANVTYTSYSKIAPTGLAATNVLPYSFNLSWAAQNGAVSYEIYKDGVLFGTSITTTLFIKGGLKANTTYSMTVKAVDAFGHLSDASTPLPVLTAAPDVTPPTAPTGLAAWDSTNISFMLKWKHSTDDIGLAGYIIYNNGDSVGFTTDTNFKVTGLVMNTTYTMTVKAIDDGLNKSAASAPLLVKTVVKDITPPSVPSNIKITNKTTHSFNLAWTCTDNVAIIEYEVIRNGVSLGKMATASLLVDGLAAGTTYAITIKAKDAAGNISSTNPIAVTTAVMDVTPPTKPTGLEVYDIQQTSFSFTFDTSKDNVGVIGYMIYLNGSIYDTITTTTVDFKGLKPGTAYEVDVIAMDASENISAPAQINVKTKASALAANENIKITVYPNPVHEWMNMTLDADADETIQITLFDIQGKLILSSEKKINSGKNNIQINTQGLSGTYILKVKLEGKEETAKIIIE